MAAVTIKVLFLSRNNAERSQMAEFLLNHMGSGRFEAVSAGNAPTPFNPLVIEVLSEMDIDACDASSKRVEIFENEVFDYVINICEFSTASCDGKKEACPSFKHCQSSGCWGFEGALSDGCSDDEVRLHLRRVRDQIANRLRVWMPAVDKSRGYDRV